MFQKIVEFLKSKKFWKIVGIITGIYILVVILTIFYLDTYTSQGEKIPVPNLLGKNLRSVGGILEANNLSFEVLDSVYDPSLAEGTIIDQDPRPTEMSELFVKEGRVVRLRVSKRTRMVEMPSLIDKSQRFAEKILMNRGIKFTVSYQNTTEAHGAVLDQIYKNGRIKEGTKIPIGSSVKLIIGRNLGGIPVPIPDLYGLTINEAQVRLTAMPEMTFFVVCEECKTAEDSLVARINSQTPEYIEGVMIPSGSTITVNAVLKFENNREEAP